MLSVPLEGNKSNKAGISLHHPRFFRLLYIEPAVTTKIDYVLAVTKS